MQATSGGGIEDQVPHPWSLETHMGIAPFPHEEQAEEDPAADIAAGDPIEMNPLTSQPQRSKPRDKKS